ncbi:concanavalin A-like lectin/glucanase domain-containing protein [Dactylonectria estremocensis]|uniref:Concanavalin A-like lectin/glucanase domain-containing protein n=1 Tax=Dactylonectria estremocensis TaxID=1079267 RepID=A0A9P9J6U8_9HYPO|nr:concanavalin A-like lectin/glucanase domain-containing protein [Dactylonectria estremocensis]
MASKVRDCDCGFIDSNDPTQSIFSSFFAVNFSSIASSKFDELFIPATYTYQRDSPNAYTRNFTADQVQLSDAGLDLTVSSPSSGSKSVPCSGIFSRSNAFFYGSYHAQFRVGDVPGTVTAFYNYKNDTSEVDIEYVSAWDEATLLYTVKPQIYLPNNNPVNSTYQRQAWNDTRASFDEDFHEWSFVWLPDIVHFGLDANYTKSITTNVPQAPGRLALNQWSDGNSNYSLGPPTKDSTVAVSFLWAVYNDTNANALTCKKATEACTITNGIFQTSTASGGDDNNDSGSTSVTIMNSVHLINPAAPGWLFALLFFFWFSCRRSLL